MVQKHSRGGKLRALQRRTQTKNNPWGTVCGEAKTKSNPRENRAKSPTENRHRESIHRENSRGWFVGLKEISTVVSVCSNAEDQLAASAANELIRGRCSAMAGTGEWIRPAGKQRKSAAELGPGGRDSYQYIKHSIQWYFHYQDIKEASFQGGAIGFSTVKSLQQRRKLSIVG